MTNTDMIREITSLSSGTVGKLIGSGNYEAIDNEVSLWVQFVVDHKDERWSSWVDCWEQYQIHRAAHAAPTNRERNQVMTRDHGARYDRIMSKIWNNVNMAMSTNDGILNMRRATKAYNAYRKIAGPIRLWVSVDDTNKRENT